jgi:CRP/FNR family transcriptional regulator
MTSPAPELIAQVKRCPVFANVADARVAQVVGASLVLDYAAGRQIIRPSQKADRFFVVLAGSVRIYKVSPKGDEQTLHQYGPGESFGEAAMLAGVSFPAYGEAVTDARLLQVTRGELTRAIARDPELAMGMMAGLSVKLREFATLIEELSLKEVPARLAGVLLREYRDRGVARFNLGRTKRQLAAQIGTVAETLSRALARLKSQGLIAVRGSEITVLDAQGLERMAGE